jgi:hypothetical protein
MVQMTRTLAILALAAAVAGCKSTGSESARSSQETAPKFERTKALWEILDERAGTRVGFVEKTTYDNGRVVYWVTDPERSVKYGYMLPNNSGYKYDWSAGERSTSARPIGADTFEANARRILGYKSPVTLREIAWETLLKEYEPPPAPPTGGAKAPVKDQ